MTDLAPNIDRTDIRALASMDRDELRAAAKAELMRKRLRYFAMNAWPAIEPATKLKWSWHLDVICDHLEAAYRGEITRLIINVPPRSLKSYLCSVVFPAWVWLNDPSRSFISASGRQQLAFRDALRTRTLIQGPWFQDTFKPAWGFKPGNKKISEYETTELGVRFSTSVGGGVTGNGASIFMIDDPLEQKHIDSEAHRQAAWNFVHEIAHTRLNNPDTDAIILIMQRLCEDDPCGIVDKPGHGWEHLKLPLAYAGEKLETCLGPYDPRTEIGEPLNPARRGRDAIAKLQATMDPFNFAGQYQQEPYPEGGGIFEQEWWQHYSLADVPPLDQAEVLIQSWDLAFKDTKGSDFVVGQVWGLWGTDMFLLDQVRGRLSFTATQDAIDRMSRKWPEARVRLIEDKANGPAVMDALGKKYPMIPIEPRGSKTARARAVTGAIRAGQVHIPHADDATWVRGFIKEATAFPRGKHDDQVDAATQAIDYLDQFVGSELIAPPDEEDNVWRRHTLSVAESEALERSKHEEALSFLEQCVVD